MRTYSFSLTELAVLSISFLTISETSVFCCKHAVEKVSQSVSLPLQSPEFRALLKNLAVWVQCSYITVRTLSLEATEGKVKRVFFFTFQPKAGPQRGGGVRKQQVCFVPGTFGPTVKCFQELHCLKWVVTVTHRCFRIGTIA